MDWPEVRQRIAKGEDVHTEFKRVLELRLVGRTVCAFGNTDGGVLVLGVDNAGQIIGVRENAHSARERLANFLQNGCNVPVYAQCQQHDAAEGTVIWVEVPRQRGFEPLRYDGRVWVRRDRNTAEPSPLELQELFNAFGYVLTEEQAVTAATVDDIDARRFGNHLARQGLDLTDPQPELADDLRNLGVLAEFDGRLHPTLFGLLAFGKQPQTFPQTTNFWIDCVAYAGTDQATDVIGSKEATGRLDEQVANAAGWARALGQREEFDDIVRRDTPVLPVAAIREALVNAVTHRDYAIIGAKAQLEVFADRVEVTSPGALPNHLSVDAVRRGGRTRTRNEQMANFMLAEGFMEKRGRGYMVMRRAMREFNGTEPQLVEDAASRFVTVRFERG